MSPNWFANKGATINPKNEKDKCFQWPTISGLNYNKIKEKDLKKYLNLKGLIRIFHYTVRIGNILNNNASVALNVLFASYGSEEIKLACKSNYNKHKNQVILLMINDESNNR